MPSIEKWHKLMNPKISTWFVEKFGVPTPVQEDAWKEIARQKDVLISSPTGSGKTFAAFLYAINQLFTNKEKGLKVLYVSPLKALSNDIQWNLTLPLQEIGELFSDLKVTAKSWTGDTEQTERNRIRKSPPEILVTTPESLYNLLTSKSGRDILQGVETLILDEIHAVAGSKRGAHLSLSIQRLEALCLKRPQRIAISATQKPIEKMCEFLLHPENHSVVNKGHGRKLDLSIQIPDSPLSAVMANEQWGEVYKQLKTIIESHKTTLVFVNNRRLCERTAKNLAELLEEESVTSHHGSLAKEHRLDAEKRLKNGQLKALVATASLELGIDIGDIDCVCQVGSPNNIQAFLQRVGRSGHSLDKTPKGILFPSTIDDLLELTALKRAVVDKKLDSVLFPSKPLDVLAQQVVAEVSMQDWGVEPLYHLFSQGYIYKDLSLSEFRQVVEMLSIGFGGNQRQNKALIFYDKVSDQLRSRKSSNLTALLNGGTIPDQFDYDVFLMPQDIQIGTLNEDFSFESIPGDIFLLGNHSYRILKIESGRVFVEDAQGQPPNIPFWFGVQMWRSDELSAEVSQMRDDISQYLQSNRSVNDFASQNSIDPQAAVQLFDYIEKIEKVLGSTPTQNNVVFERFFDENNDMHLVIHSVFGSRINRAWGLALRKKFCRQFNFELQAAADENSLILSLSESHSFDLKGVLNYLSPESLLDTLTQALLDRPLFETQWRWNASIALAIRRRNGGKKVPAQFQRNNAENLIAQLFPDQIACLENIQGDREIPDHPLIQQTLHDCTHVLMDVVGLKNLIKDLQESRIKVRFIDSSTPSPSSMAIINARNFAFLDDAPAEERRTLAIKTNHLTQLTEDFASHKLDKVIIEEVNEKSQPLMRNQDELQEAIYFSGLIPKSALNSEQKDWAEDLLRQNRIQQFIVREVVFYYSLENQSLINDVYLQVNEKQFLSSLSQLVFMKMENTGLIDFESLRESFKVSASALNQALTLLETKGQVFQLEDDRWCERHILARIRKQSKYKKRNSFELVSPRKWFYHLSERHGFGLSTFSGMEGLIETLDLLEGYSIPAKDWDEVLRSRVKDYKPYLLEQVCFSGQFVWKRILAKKSLSSSSMLSTIKNTPIAFLRRENLNSFSSTAYLESDLSVLSQTVLDSLKTCGALFADDLLAKHQCMPLQLEEALVELINVGAIFSDGVNAIKIFGMSPAQRGRYIKKSRNPKSYLNMMGRWNASPNVKESDKHYFAQILMRRYGVVFKAALENENLPIKWNEAIYELERMDAQAEIQAGRFVKTYAGVQYASSEVIKGIRKDHIVQTQNITDKDCLNFSEFVSNMESNENIFNINKL